MPGPQPAEGTGARLQAAPERYGPVTLTRWRKADGRALLLFAEQAGEPTGGEPGEAPAG